MTPVTRSFLPRLDEYMAQIERAFNNNWLTNRGILVKELESQLAEYLNLNDCGVLAMNNGTIPLQIALRLLGKGGQVITTPFSYVATTAGILWEHCTPVFVDIHPEYLTIDETRIEAAITPNTTCILATHVFGNPCNIEEIERIAQKHQLAVIYDAAHCFGVKYNGKSVFEFGDVSTCSFHATKLFHTGEGGALFCKDSDLFQKCFYTHNFGHNGPLDFHGLGINGKLSELHAAMGLAVLPHMDHVLQERKRIVEKYDEGLSGASLKNVRIRENTEWNYSYYPVIFDSEGELLEVEERLHKKNIFPRRYFCPSLNTLHFVDKVEMPISESISKRILCLPLYVDLHTEIQEEIIKITRNEK